MGIDVVCDCCIREKDVLSCKVSENCFRSNEINLRIILMKYMKKCFLFNSNSKKGDMRVLFRFQ